MNELIISGQMPDDEIPAWLREALDAEQSAAFGQKAREGVQVARGLILLRREREKVGLGRCPLADYVKALALLAGVDPVPILDWFGVRNLELVDKTISAGVGRLLRRLGVPREDVAELLIRSEAARIGVTIPALAWSGSRGFRVPCSTAPGLIDAT